jgi:exonuclease SbcC
MLTDVYASDFQSLKSVTITLGKLTVITGPSNSGKSAFGRALRATLRNNVSVAAGLRHKSKSFVLSAMVDGQEIQLTRGKSLGIYNHDGQQYTKIGTTVPDDIQDWLQMPEVLGSDLNLTTQFDAPYLLSASGSEAARALGDLTNANLLSAAAGEANRRKLEAAREVKALRARKEALEATLEGFNDLPARVEKIRAAKEALETVREAVLLRARLSDLLESIDYYQTLLDQAEPPKDRTGVTEALDMLSRAVALSGELREVVAETQRVQAVAQTADEQRQQWVKRRTDLQQSLSEALLAAGSCPVCGSTISGDVR